METPSERKPERDSAQAAVHILSAHQILKALILSVKTGGML
jgi:hypothetical protein